MHGTQADGSVTMEEFVEYYTNISASIDDDMYFSAMMNSAWNISGDASSYKKYDKGWANKDEGGPGARPGTSAYARKNNDPDGNPTLKSGMNSSDFPLSQTKYGSPQKGQSLANPRLYQEQDRGKFNQITGMESKDNPFVSNIGNKYSNHVGATQKPNEYNKPLGTMAGKKQNEIAIQKFKQKIMGRGAKGLIGLKRQFKIMDSDGSGALDMNEFKKALDDYKVGVSEQETEVLFSIFDKNRDGTINFEEFMGALLGELS
mmetsp:Transcript_15351/g.14949  ORF Transcript_15351/g.14949 Transcript_15351/m.14949 type:complete len:260 (+) Transcript_15351:520-1299(+)